MASGSGDQPIDFPTKNKLLDGNIRMLELLVEKIAPGSDNQPIDVSTKINLLDGDICTQIKQDTQTFPEITELYGYNGNGVHNVYNAHVAFLNAGSNLIRTNTYHALYPFLKTFGVTLYVADYEETVEGAVKIAQESIRGYCSKKNILETSFNIVGSCGCINDETMNFLSCDELKDAHRKRIRILKNKGIGIVSLEGIRNQEEAEMLLALMREFPNIKFLVMFNGEENLRSLVFWVKRLYCLYSSQITAIGLNNTCSDRARQFCDHLLKGRKTGNFIPLIMCTCKYGNSWNPVNLNTYAPVMEWPKLGIHYIGGAYNVVSEDIASLREKLNLL